MFSTSRCRCGEMSVREDLAARLLTDRQSADSRRLKGLRLVILVARECARAPQGVTLYEAAASLHCSARTVRRAIYALRDVGIAVIGTTEPGPAVRYSLSRLAWETAIWLPKD